MNFFGLARRSVFRKPVKSILLLLIVFAISTLLLAGVASKNASIEVQDKTRQAIGSGKRDYQWCGDLDRLDNK